MQDNKKNLEEQYQRLFSFDEGITVLEDLKRLVGYGEPSYRMNCNDKDAIFLDGQKFIISYIVRKLESKEKKTKWKHY